MSESKVTKEQILEIIELYKLRESPTIIGAKYNITNRHVLKILRKNDIPRNQLRRLDQEEIEFIIKEYISGLSTIKIAKILGLNDCSVARALKRNGIIIRSAEDNKRAYNINQNYFANIDTEEKAYFLGFMYADGNISKRGWCAKIVIHSKDQDILEKFSTAIYGFIHFQEDGISPKDGKPYIRTNVYSKKFCKDLLKLGCMPDKSFKITLPNKLLSDEMMRHFVRGYFDGDGGFDSSHPRAYFSSNKGFCNELRDYLISKNIMCNKVYTNPKRNENYGGFEITNKVNIDTLYSYLYDNSNIWMNRKYEYFQNYYNRLQNKINVKYQLKNNIVNYATSYIPSFNGIQLTNENIKLMTQDEKDQVAQFATKYYRENGFPYQYLTDDELLKEFTFVKNTNHESIFNELGIIVNNKEIKNILNINNQNGGKIAKHFNPHFYEVKSGEDLKEPSMLELYEDDDKLLKLITKRLSVNDAINGSLLRTNPLMAKDSFKASSFNVIIAKYIYMKFCKENDIIYDYSMGFGQRLTAALSLPYKIKYIGVDVLQKSVEGNIRQFEFYNTNVPMLNKEAELILCGSENYRPESLKNSVNIAFSSPPYYNLEKYSDEPEQAYSKGYNNFINSYWRKTVENIDYMLKADGLFIINVNDVASGFNVGEDMLNVIKENDFQLIEVYNIQLSKNAKYEPIYVFKKVK